MPEPSNALKAGFAGGALGASAFPLFDTSGSGGDRQEPIGLDRPAQVAFISHAHADHAKAAKAGATKNILATGATLELMRALGFSTKGKKEVALECGVSFGESVRIELLDAGHILGSAQFRAELSGGFSFAYTGDFKLENALTTKGAEVAECDVLAVDATFGSRDFEFPPREETYDDIACWTAGEQEKGNSVVLGGYALGKAQELVACLNDRLGIAPIVSEKVSKACEVYVRNGVELDFLPIASAEAQDMLKSTFVAVLPPSKVTPELASDLSSVYGRRVKTALASGWAAKYRFVGLDKTFCLSDHADFPQLLEYVEASGAQTVLCQGAHKREFAGELQARGIKACVDALRR
jgi:putative mRNA 3-end processing factor